jgi:hypothetical protein
VWSGLILNWTRTIHFEALSVARAVPAPGVCSGAWWGILRFEGATKQECGVEDEGNPRKAGNQVGDGKCSAAFSVRSHQENGRDRQR